MDMDEAGYMDRLIDTLSEANKLQKEQNELIAEMLTAIKNLATTDRAPKRSA